MFPEFKIVLWKRSGFLIWILYSPSLNAIVENWRTDKLLSQVMIELKILSFIFPTLERGNPVLYSDLQPGRAVKIRNAPV